MNLRSSVLTAQVVAEINSGGTWTRGYVYLGMQMVAIQTNQTVSWVHQDPVTKSQRITNSAGTVTSTIDLDPWGGETARSSNQAFQPHRYTSYERDANAGDEAMFRRYQSNWSRFAQPDPYDGSYNLGNPQSFNRYAYVQNDPVNFVGPSGLHHDFGLGPPPPVPILVLPYGGTIVSNTSAPRWSGGGGIFGNDHGFLIEVDDEGGGGGGGGGGVTPQRQTPPQQERCDPSFFNENETFNIQGRSFTGGDLNVAARVVYAESSSGFRRLDGVPIGDRVNDERNAIASVLFNLIDARLTTFNAVARGGRFNSVTVEGETGKFDRSGPGRYQNLRERTADGGGGDCNDLRSSVDAIRRMVNNNGPFYGFNRFRGGRTPVGNSTVIGGSRFGYGGITNTGLGPW